MSQVGMPSGGMNQERGMSMSEDTTISNLREMPWVEKPGLGDSETSDLVDMTGEWTNWKSLGGTCISAPAAASWGENRLDVFSIGINSQLYHKCWDGQQWKDWESLGGTCIYTPAAVSWGANRLDVFAIGIDKQVYHKWWDGAKWNGWESLGGTCIHGVAAASWGANRIDLFSVGTDSVLYHKWWDGSSWIDWKPLVLKGQMEWEKSSTSICTPAAVASHANRIDIFTLGIDNQVYHAWGDGQEWIGWENLGGPAIQGIAAASRSANSIDLFTIGTDVVGTDNHTYHRSMEGSRWSDWENLGGACISAPAAVALSENRLDTFAIGTRSELWNKSWTKESGTLRVSQTEYKSVQFIGYFLPTGTFSECNYLGKDADYYYGQVTQKYLGSEDIELDWQSRCTLMGEAIEQAFDKAETDTSTLKVFVAPEFYFRGPLGAYSLEIFDKIVEELRKKVSDEQWKHWLFVFGTIIGMADLNSEADDEADDSDSNSNNQKPKKIKEKEIYNTALIQKGYIPDMTNVEYEAKAVIKEYKSNIDFASEGWKVVREPKNGKKDFLLKYKLYPNDMLSDNDVQSIFKKNNSTGSGKEKQIWSYDGLGIFEVDGITFGLEVCLDHAQKRLKLSPPDSGDKKVQVQLIPSAGMSIQEASVIAVEDGLVFNCDGSGDGHTQLAKVIKKFDDFKNASTTRILDYEEIDITKKSVENSHLYFEKLGKLHIYKIQDIPTSK